MPPRWWGSPFGGNRKLSMSKVKFVIEYAGLQLLVLKNQSGEDVTPLKPISDLFGMSWEDQRKKVSNDAFRGKFMGTCTGDIPGADGPAQAPG